MTSPAVCIGCGGSFADNDGPTHPYMLSSAGCWARYGQVLAREYGDPALFGAVHRLTVDAYALQHPGLPGDPRANRSVWIHFAALHAILSQGLSHADATARLAKIARHDFPPLPPAPRHGITLASLNLATGSTHVAEITRWAEAAYEA